MVIQVQATFDVGNSPAFNGMAERVLDEFEDAWKNEIAMVGSAEIRQATWSTFMNPTGAWASGVRYEDRADDVVIHDSRSVYGPWLEGVSRRNQTTRFKGYSLFRKKGQDLAARGAQIANQMLPAFLARIR